jgi:hypothetical protein
MKSVIATLGLFTALTTASYQHPRHFHYRRDNASATADAGAFTTLTVLTTEIQTITSCAPTITDCPAATEALSTLPASALQTILVTNTIVLTETVCPVTEAASISSAIMSSAKDGKIKGKKTLTGKKGGKKTKSVSVPLKTGVEETKTTASVDATATDDAEESACPPDEVVTQTSVTHIVTEKTLTMTVGKGDAASIVTTTIQSTIESTKYVVCPQRPPEHPRNRTDSPPTRLSL